MYQFDLYGINLSIIFEPFMNHTGIKNPQILSEGKFFYLVTLLINNKRLYQVYYASSISTILASTALSSFLPNTFSSKIGK
jgi:hypothetical protein